MKRIFFLLGFIFLTPVAFLLTLPEAYDLLGHAAEAKWRNDRGRVLHFPGSANDPRGFVRFGSMRLEDGSTSSGVLETHPRWDTEGWIEGEFSVSVPEGSLFEAEVGFLEGANGTDGVVFEVFWRKGGTEAVLARLEKAYSGRLASIRADLAAYAGHSGRIALRVKAGSSSGKDWAAWKKAAIIQAPFVSIQQATSPAQAKAQAPKPQREHPVGKAIPAATILDAQEFPAHPNWDIKTVKFLFEKDKDRLGVQMEFFAGPLPDRFYLSFNTNTDETADFSLICQPDKFEIIRGANVIPPFDVIYSGTPVVSDRTYSLDFPWHHLMTLIDRAYVWVLVPNSGERVPDEGYRAELNYDRNNVEIYPDQDRDYISDDVEYRLLQKFSPYFKFARKDGEEESYRPSDPVWQLQFADLRNDDWQDGYPPDKVNGCPDPISPPERLLDCLGGRTDLLENPTKTRYFINIGDDRGRPGPPWSDILAEGHTGTFGHVVPAELGFCKNDRASQVLGPEVRRYYKVEYWQYFGYNGVDDYCCDHEGDWCTVQLWVDPETENPVLTVHFTHGKGFFYDLRKTRDVVAVDEHIEEQRGPNFGRDMGFPLFGGERYRPDSQDNHVQFYDRTHVVVYWERNSHECWPSWRGDLTGAAEHNGKGVCYLTRDVPNLGEVEFPFGASAKIILRFNGYWGAFHHHKNFPPPGPTLHCQWTWPPRPEATLRNDACRECEF